MNTLQKQLLAQVVVRNAITNVRHRGHGTLLTSVAYKGMGDCDGGCGCGGTCGGLGAAPAGAAPDYVCAGSRYKYTATVTQGVASAAPIFSPNGAIQANLTSQGVQVNSITDNAGVLSYVAGSFASWQITIDVIWPIDMSHRGDVQGVIDAAVNAAGVNVGSSSLVTIQDACSAGPSNPSAAAPVDKNQNPSSPGCWNSQNSLTSNLTNCLGISGTLPGYLLIAAGVIGLAFVVPKLLK